MYLKNCDISCLINSFAKSNRPLSRDVTHDKLRVWPPCCRENKKEQKTFWNKIRVIILNIIANIE